mmetsp:Transcript_32012/g.53983  ORF Transcript_32012/g.53983 Transcript_32012/m.53983 type:complete len:593 (-) Transcript_32012:520-2298(-)
MADASAKPPPPPPPPPPPVVVPNIAMFNFTTPTPGAGLRGKKGDGAGDTGNVLINALGVPFFSTGKIPVDDIQKAVVTIKTSFEDGSGSDDELKTAIQYQNYTLVCFLLSVVNSDSLPTGSEDTRDMASRSLAFAAEICPGLWPSFSEIGSLNAHIAMILQAARSAIQCVNILLSNLPQTGPANPEFAYLGYDDRDARDYNMEGYAADSAQAEEEKARIEGETHRIQDTVMVWLLMLYQMFSHPLAPLRKKVVATRLKQQQQKQGGSNGSGSSGSSSGRYSSKRLQKLHDTASTSTSTSTSSSSSGGVLRLESIDIILYLRDTLTAGLLSLLCSRRLADDAYSQCMKAVAVLNSQMPPLHPTERNFNELTAFFATVDVTPTLEPAEVNGLSQALLNLLNENGYPHIHAQETLAVIRLCKDLLHVAPTPTTAATAPIVKHEDEDDQDAEAADLGATFISVGSVDSSGAHTTGSDASAPAMVGNGANAAGAEDVLNISINTGSTAEYAENMNNVNANNNRGHFYTNDIKVLVDICIRELFNIPPTGSSSASGSSSGDSTATSAEIYGQVRFMYLELLDAIISKSSWSSSGECYM